MMQSLRQILEIHSNLLFQLEQLDIDNHESFIQLLQLFVSMTSPYVYYAAVIKESSLAIET